MIKSFKFLTNENSLRECVYEKMKKLLTINTRSKYLGIIFEKNSDQFVR